MSCVLNPKWHASYAVQVRGTGGVALADGVDCLLVALLGELGATAQLEAFVSGSTQVAAELAGP